MKTKYEIHPTKSWLAAIDIENFPATDPNTDEGKETLTTYACAIFYENSAIQHVVIRRGGKVIGEVANGGLALSGRQTLQ